MVAVTWLFRHIQPTATTKAVPMQTRFAFRRFSAAIALSLIGAAPVPDYVVGQPIAGPDGGWDYASVDPASGQVYVARSESVTVVDLAHPASPRSIGMIARGHAAVPIPNFGLLLVTSGRDDSVRLLDLKDGHEVAKIAVGANPDAAFYDAQLRAAVVMNAKSGTVSVIGLAARKVVRTITLKPGLEFGVLGAGQVLFVNNEDENEIETADLRTGKVGTAIPMPGCEGPTGLGFDARNNRLISACGNGKAAIVDASARRRLTALLDIGNGPDAVILDTVRRRAFIPCGRSAVLEILSLDAAGGPKVTGAVKTEMGARTGTLDPRTGMLYLPAANYAAPAAPGARATPIPGTFHLVVIAPRPM